MIKTTIRKWEQLTQCVLALQEISVDYIQELLGETQEVLSQYQEEKFVPKEIVKLFLEMDGFLYFASMMENNEVSLDFYHYQEVSQQIDALKKTFFGN